MTFYLVDHRGVRKVKCHVEGLILLIFVKQSTRFADKNRWSKSRAVTFGHRLRKSGMKLGHPPAVKVDGKNMFQPIIEHSKGTFLCFEEETRAAIIAR